MKSFKWALLQVKDNNGNWVTLASNIGKEQASELLRDREWCDTAAFKKLGNRLQFPLQYRTILQNDSRLMKGNPKILGIGSILRKCPKCKLGAVVIRAKKGNEFIALCERCNYREIYYKNPRFDAPKKAAIQKWYAILTYNGTQLLARVVTTFDKKSKANNYAKDLIGKTYKGHLVTTVVLEGPFKTMSAANNVQVVLPLPA